jgi:hypothetical protein
LTLIVHPSAARPPFRKLIVNLYRVLGESIAESVNAVGAAVRSLSLSSGPSGTATSADGWADQFSAASLDDRRARRTVEALFRAATVRL